MNEDKVIGQNKTINIGQPDLNNEQPHDPLEDFYGLANNILSDRSKEPSVGIAIIYGALNLLARQGKITGSQIEQVLGSFTISYLNLLS